LIFFFLNFNTSVMRRCWRVESCIWMEIWYYVWYRETCGATRNFGTNSLFVLARRKTTENLDEDMNIRCNQRLAFVAQRTQFAFLRRITCWI